MNSKRTIVVIGGGPAGLSAALSLTDPTLHPNWRDEYDVVVLQMGWRAGGKGATGRRGTAVHDGSQWCLEGDARVEEHGIHLFGNMYQNALRLLDGCLGELDRSVGEPVATMQNSLVPSNSLQLADYFGSQWHLTPQHLPHNDLQPWASQDYPGPLVLFREMLRLAGDLVAEVLGIDAGEEGGRAIHAELLAHRHVLEELHAFHDLHPALPVADHHGGAVEHLTKSAELVHRRLLHEDPWTDAFARIRSVWCQLELYATVARGVVDDQIFQNGLDSVDAEDFRHWCRRHGMDEVALNSSPVQLPAQMCFQFPEGDTTLPPLFSAAGFLWFVLRQILACGQATYWFHRGTGDTVVAPLYRVARQRGVQFRFFHKVTEVGFDADSETIDRIEIDIQATTVGRHAYDPLVRLGDGTWAWPNRPIYGQLEQGDELRDRHVDLESWWNDWAPVETVTMRLGEDFDEVVMALPLPCLPLVAPGLVANAAWEPAVDGLGEIVTISAQIWTNRTSAQLGLPALRGTDRVCSGAAVAPLGVADMTDVLGAENWDALGAEAPRGLYYFCGPIEHHGAWPPFSAHDTPTIAKQSARSTLVQWLRTAVSVFPGAGTDPVNPESFDMQALWCPPGNDQRGEPRIDHQYVRANIDPNERYVPSPPGTAALRPQAWESGARNLALASDWIFTGINIGSFEGAVMSGLLAAHALTGVPALHDIAGYEFGRPHPQMADAVPATRSAP